MDSFQCLSNYSPTLAEKIKNYEKLEKQDRLLTDDKIYGDPDYCLVGEFQTRLHNIVRDLDYSKIWEQVDAAVDEIVDCMTCYDFQYHKFPTLFKIKNGKSRNNLIRKNGTIKKWCDHVKKKHELVLIKYNLLGKIATTDLEVDDY